MVEFYEILEPTTCMTQIETFMWHWEWNSRICK